MNECLRFARAGAWCDKYLLILYSLFVLLIFSLYHHEWDESITMSCWLFLNFLVKGLEYVCVYVCILKIYSYLQIREIKYGIESRHSFLINYVCSFIINYFSILTLTKHIYLYTYHQFCGWMHRIMSEAIILSIPSYTKKESYTLYAVNAKSSLSDWTVLKRFSSFAAVHTELSKWLTHTYIHSKKICMNFRMIMPNPSLKYFL